MPKARFVPAVPKRQELTGVPWRRNSDQVTAPPLLISEVDWKIVRSGWKEVTQWLEATGMAFGLERQWVDCAFNMDYHDVIDAMTESEKKKFAEELGKIEIPSFVCSFGWSHAEDTLNESLTCPLMSTFNGMVFTKHREHLHKDVDVDRPEGWPMWAIRVKGDKSFLSRLLRIPVLLMDDKEANAEIHSKGHEGNRAVFCKKGRKSHHQRLQGYVYESRSDMWPALIGQFAGAEADA
jgi:hypothetical protein